MNSYFPGCRQRFTLVDEELQKSSDEEDSKSSQDDDTGDSHVSGFIGTEPGDTHYGSLIDDIEGEVVLKI